jgi:serine/threonine protein kinase
MNRPNPSFNGIPGFDEFSTLLPAIASRRTQGSRHSYGHPGHPIAQLPGIAEEEGSPSVNGLPPFIRILNTLLVNTASGNDNENPESFITNVGILHDVAFSPKCPILGTGHHFAVFAAPFDVEDRGYIAVDGRAVNPEVYCLKTPNFSSNGAADSPASKSAFRAEYYNTALQEIRVLLHPRLRRCENIISLFGLDFQEDYDDYTVAWPVLLMEYAEHGTLATLQEDINIDTELARILLLDVAQGIKALHECNIIHGDVKSENVLICRHAQRKYIAKLADFGLSVINPDSEGKRHTLPGGTVPWTAPEISTALSVEGLRQTDVYSFGLMAWRVWVNRANPFILIPPASLGSGPPRTVNEAATLAKSRDDFDMLVLQTMRSSGSDSYSLQVIKATLRKEPTSRSLGMAISVLKCGQETVLLR